MAEERITILRDILLELHNGASAESVQDRFNKHFTGVSAIEISLMEHELMNSDSGVTFEDVMSLCDVHANLFKGAIKEVEVADTEHPGHPVQVFRQENMALRAAIMRLRRLIENVGQVEEDMQDELLKGLKRQMGLLAQFDRHYRRKEELMFPIMESYGHDSPPKVMWGVDDQIRQLFLEAQEALEEMQALDMTAFSKSFESFAQEFESMIFKEESILLMILLESFNQDDWIKIAKESPAYGYAIISPTEKWVPERVQFLDKESPAQEDIPNSQEAIGLGQGLEKVIDTPQGQWSISFTPKSQALDPHKQEAFGNGSLSFYEANLLLNHLPMEISFVNKDDIFQYYNDSVPADEMIFKRTPSQIGRNVELCHPPKHQEKVRRIFQAFRSGEKDQFQMWFKSESRGKFVHVTYKAVRDEEGNFQGALEYVQDIQPYRDIEQDFYKELNEGAGDE